MQFVLYEGRNLMVSDYSTVWELLNVEPATLYVMALEHKEWGRLFSVLLRYDDDGQTRDFHMRFKDCHEIRWQPFLEKPFVDEAEVIAMQMMLNGEKQVMIHTLNFEISFFYRRVAVEPVE